MFDSHSTMNHSPSPEELRRRCQRLADSAPADLEQLDWHVEAANVGDLRSLAAASLASGR